MDKSKGIPAFKFASGTNRDKLETVLAALKESDVIADWRSAPDPLNMYVESYIVNLKPAETKCETK